MINIKKAFSLSKDKQRKIKDGAGLGSIFLFSSFTFVILIWMIVYVFQNGTSLLNSNFLFGDYSQKVTTIKSKDSSYVPLEYNFKNTSKAENFSSRWGIGIENRTHSEEDVIYIVSIEKDSPFLDLVDNNNEKVTIDASYYLSSLTLFMDDGDIEVFGPKDGASNIVKGLDKAYSIFDGTLTSPGKGIRGSLLTTLALIGFSLLFSLPLGIGGAIYLSCYAKDNFIANMIRTLIDVTSGIPSIIFGLAGAIIFIPFLNTITSTNGGSLFSGSLTMAIMLLPTIVKTVEESIKMVPHSLKDASLSLGASQAQTIFKIILPNAMPGILSATLLSIGRIIGESAALIFSMGAIIGDNLSLLEGHASLAVHIWTCLQGETPQYGSACAISIIILIVVLLLSLLVKLLSFSLKKKKGI